jgi:hypothetical protein
MIRASCRSHLQRLLTRRSEGIFVNSSFEKLRH